MNLFKKIINPNNVTLEQLEKHLLSIRAPFSMDDKYVISFYTGQGFYEMNDHLWNGIAVDNKVKVSIDDLSSLIDKNKLDIDIISYRGFNRNFVDFDNLEIGEEWESKGFLSTSLNEKIAYERAKNNNGGYVFQIRALRGTNALFLGNDSLMPQEKELLIQKGTYFSIIELDKNNRTGVMMVIIND